MKNSTPPEAISHTSLPFHTGPMVAVACSRSSSVRARIRCMAPIPRSKPSSTTYMAIIAARKQNQAVLTSPPPAAPPPRL